MNAVIMAGGSGSRFWPLSRVNRPKQFLSLWEGETLILKTVERLVPLCGDNIYVVTQASYEDMTLAHAPSLKPDKLILEPFGRNTAAAIGLSAIKLKREGKGAEPVVFCPADHIIGDDNSFREAVKKAAESARDGLLMVFGVAPDEPSPHYGYIEIGQPVRHHQHVKMVKRFVEKPSIERAEAMIEAGGYCWNAGIFVWTPDAILEAIARHMPDLTDALKKIDDAPDDEKILEAEYKALASVPIDIGVLERADNIGVILTDMKWRDIGSWSGLKAVMDKSAASNATHGKTVVMKSSDCLVWSSGRVVAALGVEGVAIIETPEAVFVCSMKHEQDIKELLELLDKEGHGEIR